MSGEPKEKQHMRRAVSLLVVALVTSHSALVTPVAVLAEEGEGVRVVHLAGTPYELGRQHGELLREEVRASVARLLGYFRRYLKIPLIRSWAVNWWLETAWRRARPFVPSAYLDELRGLSEGAGVPLRELIRLHAIPERTYACSSFAAWGRATLDGRLLHLRNLDWTIEAGAQRFATVFVVRPTGKRAFINVGWAGFIGVLSGVNEARLSIGQIGAETVDLSYRGLPMPWLIRKVLEEAGDLAQAEQIIRAAPRTVGINYVVADATARRAIALETTRELVAAFEADDPRERAVSYARPIADAVFRADTAMDPAVRDRQLASKGNPRRPGLEAPTGSAYEVRYLGLADGILAHYGTLTPVLAQEIARAVAPDSNIQSVVFAWPELWVADAQGHTPAARTIYHRLDAEKLLEPPPASGNK